MILKNKVYLNGAVRKDYHFNMVVSNKYPE